MAFNVLVTHLAEKLPLIASSSKISDEKNWPVPKKINVPLQLLVDFLIDRDRCKYPVRIFDIEAQD